MSDERDVGRDYFIAKNLTYWSGSGLDRRTFIRWTSPSTLSAGGELLVPAAAETAGGDPEPVRSAKVGDEGEASSTP